MTLGSFIKQWQSSFDKEVKELYADSDTDL
jgi:hypothetical protein